MNKTLLFLLAVVLFLVGCANPTHVYHPLELPDANKGEIVKYENVILKVQPRSVAYELKTNGVVTLFGADRFCYDPQNDYIAIPTGPVPSLDPATDGLFFVVPKDSVTLCKNGVVKNNSYFSRNHVLKGFTIGTIAVGGFMTFGALALSPMFLLFGADVTPFILGSMGIGVVTGGAGGSLLGYGLNDRIVEDIEETCSEYFTEEELKYYLEANLCF